MYQIFLQVLSPEVGDKVISELTRTYQVTKTNCQQGLISFTVASDPDIGENIFNNIVDILDDWVWFSIVIIGTNKLTNKVTFDYAEGNFRSKINAYQH